MKESPGLANPLPYQDTKAEGAAGFYLGINATFRFIRRRFGVAGLIQYWRDLGREYFAPVSRRWTKGGLPAVAEYWRAFFAAEPGSDVSVEEQADAVVLVVHRCPAIGYLRVNSQAIVEEFCDHCYWVSNSIGEPGGIKVRIQGGNGSCRQEFSRSAVDQNFDEISRCQ